MPLTPDTPAGHTVVAQFKSIDGDFTSPSINLPATVNPEQLSLLLNQILSNDEPAPYSFYVEDQEIFKSLQEDILIGKKKSSEDTLQIIYQPQALFRVKPATRCSSSLSGHQKEILSVAFSPDGQRLATGSGDATVRFWDLNTETPLVTGTGHSNWVLCICWSPDGRFLASSSMDNSVIVWDGVDGRQIGKPLLGHTRFVSCLSWEPLHLNPSSSRLVSGSKDGSVRVWDVVKKQCLLVMSAHTDAVTCVKWSGEGHILSGSRDRTIKMWDSTDGKLIRSLEGHAHWINTMALSTDYVMRIGAFDHTGKTDVDGSDLPAVAQAAFLKYNNSKGSTAPERLVSGSDDFTMFLWHPSLSKRPISRLTGHQAVVNQVLFSPDGRFIASCSFDKSIKLWNAHTGQFITSFRGHVQAVYQIAFSADSRYLLSGSKDSTLKIWSIRTKSLHTELPGHLDEVYAVDWSPTGDTIASGGKDRQVKIWKQ